jgi:hypothetical protein
MNPHEITRPTTQPFVERAALSRISTPDTKITNRRVALIP